jgi:DNA end-binding protein Ku
LDLLRDSDHSRINYKKVAEADGQEVPKEHIVKGYQYERGQYVVITPDIFERVQVKSTQTVDIREFVNTAEIDSRYYDAPYFLAPEKQGAKAYALLHAALKETGLAGLAKVVIRPPREHLALVKPLDGVLMLETLHFADELRDPSEVNIPKVDVGEKELKMALSLVETMADKWEPEKYKDEYREGLLKSIDELVQSGGKAPSAAPKPRTESRNVIDLVDLLQKSLGSVEKNKKQKAAPKQKTQHRKAA